MKWVFRALTLVSLMAALALPLFIQDRQGNNLPGISLPGADKAPALVRVPESLEPEVKRQVYKWRDAGGILHYGDTPPDGVTYETLTVSNRVNVIKSIPVKRPQAEDSAGMTAAAEVTPKAMLPPATQEVLEDAEKKDVLSVDRALHIMEEAKAVRDLMEARNQQLEHLVGQ